MVKGMKGDPAKCPSFGTSNGPQPEAEPGTGDAPPTTKTVEQQKRQAKKVLDSKLISGMGLLLALSEIGGLVLFEDIDPFFVLLWVVSSAAYITCAFLSYMSDLEGWTEWPIITATTLLGTCLPIYLTFAYSMRWPRATGMDDLLYNQVIYGPTVYLFLCYCASKINENEDEEQENREREHMEKVVSEHKENMRGVMSQVNRDDVQKAMADALAKMNEEDKKLK